MAYSAYLLNDKERNVLLKMFPTKYPNVFAHHITHKFGIPKNTPKPEKPSSVKIVGYADNGDSLEVFVVEIDGSIKRPDGGIYHITWSLDKTKGMKPVNSNDLIKRGWTKFDKKIKIDVSPSIQY